jgi:Domain of unknown function (DUF4381)
MNQNPIINPAALLKELKPIHLPKPISPWQLAPIEYISIFIIMSLLIITTALIIRRIYYGYYKRQALQILKTLEHKKELSTIETAAQINILLKRVTMCYHKKAMAHNLEGKAWIDFLSATSPKSINFKDLEYMLTILPYKKNIEAKEDLQLLFKSAKKWIKARQIPC